VLQGGGIRGGTVGSAGAVALVAGAGALDGVTLAGDLEVPQGGQLTVSNGLTLEGEARLHSDGYWWAFGGAGAAVLRFQGAQALAGNGTVTFDGPGAGALLVDGPGAQLTLGPGLTVRAAGAGGAAIGPAVNEGTVRADAAGAYVELLGLGGTPLQPRGTEYGRIRTEYGGLIRIWPSGLIVALPAEGGAR
jgi:hypothetical protein